MRGSTLGEFARRVGPALTAIFPSLSRGKATLRDDQAVVFPVASIPSEGITRGGIQATMIINVDISVKHYYKSCRYIT